MIAPREICFALMLSSAFAAPAFAEQPVQRFEARVRERATLLTIPGIAYAVVRNGKVEHTGAISTGDGPAIGTDTALRFASVTKVFTAVLLMRDVERGKLSLDDSVSKWLPEFADRPQITVRHLAAHVSEGIPGAEFVYGTNRYARLGNILAKIHGSTFEAALRSEAVEKAGMTWHASPDLGAQAALVSTVNDVARFAAALQKYSLVTAKTFETMTTPFVSTAGVPQPVGVGFFTQVIGGERVVWSFGQDDPDYSSALLLMLPKRKLALVMLANTDELSNPFRLLMGNVRTSPFAIAFLDAYAPDLAHDVSARDRDISDMLALGAVGDANALLNRMQAFAAREPATFPNDFALHFLAGLMPAQIPRGICESVDASVVAAHPGNRWALLMSGGIQDALGNSHRALERYEALLALPNQEQDGLARLFRAWAYSGMAMALRETDPARARGYVDEGLATGVTGGTRDSLLQIKQQLGGP